MANASITAWLKQSEKNYETGVLLYDQFGESKLLKSFFKSGKGAYHLSRLSETLAKLNDQLQDSLPVPLAIIAPPAPVPAYQPGGHVQKKILSLTDTEWNNAPNEIKDLYTLNSRLKSQAELLHHQIRIAPAAEQRLAMALQLLDAREQRNENWKVIKDFQATGKLKEKIIAENEKTIDENTMVELTAIIRNTPTYLSKDRAKLAGMPDGSKKNKVLNRIRENEIKLDLAKKRLENVRII